MKKKHYSSRTNSSKLTRILLAIVLFLLLLIAIMLVFVKCGSKDTTDTITSNVERPTSIAIPGYEGLELIAGTKKQTLCLPNPEQNKCYFQISIYLEDGTLLWKSELIEPGKTSKPVKLSEPLVEGTYRNAILHYDCFTMDGSMTPLNGAEMKFTLRVNK